MSAPVTFALPGTFDALTGGTIYDRRLCEAMADAGRDVVPLFLDDSFPAPGQAAMAEALDRLAAVPRDRVLVVDGLAFGALDPSGLKRIHAPLAVMVHHPLALESGLAPAEAERLFRTERENLSLARHVLVPSPHIGALVTDRYGVAPERITVARPGTDRVPAPPVPAMKAAPPLILAVGMLHPRKGHDILIESLARVGDLSWQAVIAGRERADGERDRLSGRADAHGLRDRVRIAGEVSRDALQHLYREATLFALATRYEGYGIVFDEALQHGLPIVSCRSGAVPGTVPESAGILVETDDVEGFAEALRSLLGDPARRAVCSHAAGEAGARLPGWEETARIAGAALDRVASTNA